MAISVGHLLMIRCDQTGHYYHTMLAPRAWRMARALPTLTSFALETRHLHASASWLHAVPSAETTTTNSEPTAPTSTSNSGRLSTFFEADDMFVGTEWESKRRPVGMTLEHSGRSRMRGMFKTRACIPVRVAHR